MKSADQKSGELTIWVSLAVNISLVIAKLALGIIGHSKALIADAVHSTSDLVTDVLAWFGLKFAYMGEDQDHPFGHGKIDTLMTLIIGLALILVGFWLGYGAVESIVEGTFGRPTFWALFGAIASIILKEWMYQWTARVGRRIGNQSIIANAWHHRSDALSSVAVLCGLGPAIINPDWAILDPIAAALVSIFIIKVGIQIVVPAFRSASDASPSKNELEEIRKSALGVEGVRDAHDIRARYYSSRIYAEVHIVVDPKMTVAEAHVIGVAVRQKIRAEVKNMLDVIVHIDPDDGLSNIPTRDI